MSLDLRILPLVANRPTAGAIMDAWVRHCHGALRARLGSRPRLIVLPSHTPLESDDMIEPETSYIFSLPEANTLTLDDVPLDEWTDVAAETEDFGANLSASERELIASAWKRSGYSLWIQSMGGRGPHELELLSALARGLANLCSGWIMVETSAFTDVPVGIYHPDDLANRAFKLRRKWS